MSSLAGRATTASPSTTPRKPSYDNVYVDSGTNNDLVILSPNGKRVNFSTFVLGAGNDSASGGGRNFRNTFYGGPGNDFVLDGSESGTRAIYMGSGNDRVLHGGPRFESGLSTSVLATTCTKPRCLGKSSAALAMIASTLAGPRADSIYMRAPETTTSTSTQTRVATPSTWEPARTTLISGGTQARSTWGLAKTR